MSLDIISLASGDGLARLRGLVLADDWPAFEVALRRVGATAAPTVLELRAAEGRDRFLSVTLGSPSGGADGPVAVVRDVTDRRRANAGARFLAEAGALLVRSLDVRTTLQQVASLAVPLLADWCVIELPAADGSLEAVALADRDPGRIERGRELRQRHASRIDDPQGVAAVLRSGASELYPRIDDALLEARTRDADELELARAIGVASAMIVPLVGRDRPLGAITLISTTDSARTYGAADLELAEELGRRAGLAVENARLFAAERDAREALERVMDMAPTFAEGRSPDEVAHTVCLRAVEVFGCTNASLWRVDADAIRVLARSAPSPHLPPGTMLPVDQVHELRSHVLRGRPVFVSTPYDSTDLSDYGRRAGVASALLVPIAAHSEVGWMLSLTWADPIAEPPPAVLAAAQRYGDQAALALENAHRRAAQAEAERLSQGLERLLELAPAFAGSPAALDQTASRICDAARQTFGSDGAAIWSVEADGFSLVARRPASAGRAEDERLPRTDGIAAALMVPRLSFVPDLLEAEDEAWRRLAVATGTRSVLRLPLAHGDSVESILMLSWREVMARPSAERLALAQRFADQAALALDEARLRRAEAETASLHQRLEAGLLPRLRERLAGHAVTTRYHAGEHRLRLGGDFLDALELRDGSLAVVVGDVSGHTAEAAALGTTLRAAWRALVLSGASHAEALTTLDELVRRERHADETFVTVALGQLDADGRTWTLTLAGHLPPLVLGERVVSPALPPGPPLGVVERPVWISTTFRAAPETRMLFFTDGLIEGRMEPHSAARLGEDTLTALAEGLRDATDAALLEGLHDAARRANGRELADDVAMLLVRAEHVVSTGNTLTLALRLPATAETVSLVRRRVVELSERLGVARDERGAVAIAVTEAAANVVTHAYVGLRAEPLLEVDAWPEEQALVVVVRDFGRGLVPRGDSPGLGLGLALIASSSDHLELRSAETNGGATEVVMHFRLDATREAPAG